MFGGVGVEIEGVVGLLGRMGGGGKMGRFSCMLEIEHNVNDTTNYVKCLVTSHNAAILEKVRENPIRIFHI